MTPPLTSADFEAACDEKITGDLWDSTFSPTYQESITLSIREMRYLANLLRAAQGLPAGELFTHDCDKE